MMLTAKTIISEHWSFVRLLICNVQKLSELWKGRDWHVNLQQKHDTCPNRRRHETCPRQGQWSAAAPRTFHRQYCPDSSCSPQLPPTWTNKQKSHTQFNNYIAVVENTVLWCDSLDIKKGIRPLEWMPFWCPTRRVTAPI